MYALKLIKGLSCKVGKVRATKKTPEVIVENKADADAAIATGYFELVETKDDNLNDGKPIKEMTIGELDRYAADNCIDLVGCKSRGEKLSKILEAVSSNEDDEQEIDFNL